MLIENNQNKLRAKQIANEFCDLMKRQVMGVSVTSKVNLQPEWYSGW